MAQVIQITNRWQERIGALVNNAGDFDQRPKRLDQQAAALLSATNVNLRLLSQAGPNVSGRLGLVGLKSRSDP